jgi:hypothetical protein
MPTPKQLHALKFTCRRDFRAQCRGVPPGGQAAFACLVEHQRRLSQDCRTSVRAILLSAPAAAVLPPPPNPAMSPSPVDAAVMVRDCKRDMFRHCRGVGVGGGRMLRCLLAHQPELSFRCRTALKVTSPMR